MGPSITTPGRGKILLWLCLAAGLRAQTAVPWSSYAHDPQHTGLSTIGAQRLEQIKWTTPIDLVLQNTSGPLYIHYGSPLVTAANTVLVPVRTNSSNTYRMEAHSGANGTLLYTLATDFTPPPYNWIPSYSPALSQGTRLYYPGAGGTVYYRDQPDSASGPSGQIAFYGNALYAAHQAAFAGTVMISTPITADANGNIYFGFDVTGSNPANLTSGLARIGADGTGSWISASAAAQGDTSIVEVAMNCAPAVSNDGSTVYFGVSQGPVGVGSSAGYLVAVNSTTLAPVARVRLIDPSTGNDAVVTDESSASPTVGPDGDVYYGVLESVCCLNDDRGWLLHFDATLAQKKRPGAFGWDTTASVVPASLVPSYTGTSSYLLFTKYNNYFNIGPGGNGQNKVAVLDPNGTETDPITGATVMAEAISILGPTPNSKGGVREWCINSGAIDPFAASAMANSEDGTLYRWAFASNSFIQQVTLTAGVGEAYTPTSIGADGKAYAINDANLFAVGQASGLTISSSHTGNFVPGQSGAVYTLTVTNGGSGTTSGIVTVTDTLPASLTATAIAGQGWACTQPAGPCTRSNALQAGASYPALTLTANVAANTPSTVTNTATVSSDGAVNSVNATAHDVTAIVTPALPLLSIAKTHAGNFAQEQVDATYLVTVSNASGAGPTSGTVTVTETVPVGLTLLSMSGTGWSCSGATCTRSDGLNPGASYTPITVTVSVASNAPSQVTNQVSVSGGGSATAGANDVTTISANAPSGSAPTITLVANAEGESPVIAPNTWVEIKGALLAPAGDTRPWQASDFANGDMPTQLDGVAVAVNGKLAYVYYISPTQVNLLTPPDALPGTVQVQLTNNGATSAPFSAVGEPLSPSFFVFNGGPYVAAEHLNWSFLGPLSLYPGLTTPAAPGETVVLYGNGFGPTNVPVVSGSETQSGTLSPLPAIAIGGIDATVLFAGLVAPGEFQFNVIVPASLGTGDQPITATYNNLTTQAGTLITVQK